MSESIRDQLLALGFSKRAPEKPRPAPTQGGKPSAKGAPGKHAAPGKPAAPARPDARKQGPREIDLAQAYALRARSEREAREQAEHQARERAREKRERKEKLAQLLVGKSLNIAEADVARHFEHAGKIRRVYVTAEQLAALNRGELGVVASAGRYVLVDRTTALAAQALWPEVLLLLPEPGSEPSDDIPPDLVW